ncbi:MAG: ABC transporter substrate-binding protein [Treponema sp.]|jgi:iron complex transport system substrate-binding protein|nr:ABC transporter substrate-binding protein [Treponema sp.]
MELILSAKVKNKLKSLRRPSPSFRLFTVVCIVLLLLSACKRPQDALGNGQSRAFTFTDDDDNIVKLNEPYRRIISLYSVHTENLFAIGAGAYLIGVQSSAAYPPEADLLPKYTYSGDPEHVIAANPDLVLIRPFIRRQNPGYINELEMAGIAVVSLYPEQFDDFDAYIRRLAALSGREAEAEEKLSAFHNKLASISAQASNIEHKRTVFFESTEHELRTVAAESLPAKAIEFAGGINIAAGAKALRPGSSIAPFGVEKILEHADEIDVYIVQQGAMNQTKNIAEFSARPGFGALKALREGHVFFIDEKIISSPTFRYLDGLREMAQILLP